MILKQKKTKLKPRIKLKANKCNYIIYTIYKDLLTKITLSS